MLYCFTALWCEDNILMEKHRNWQQGSSMRRSLTKVVQLKRAIKKPNTIQCCIWECTFPWRGMWKKGDVSRNCLCFINYPADSHSNYPPLSFFSSSPSRWITGVIRMNVCPALNEIVISVVVISVGDMNHCPSVLTSSHPAPGYRQPSHANSLAHRVQFSPSNKAPG